MHNEEFPLVSIIIPTHNRRHLVERAVLSVLNQTYPNWELHIIDDGSTDDTWSYLLTQLMQWKRQIQSFGRMLKSIQIHQIEHRGVSAARNFGIQKSSGDWVCFLDSDDEWFKEKLEKQIQYHKDHKELYFSQTTEIWNKNGNLLEPKGKYKKLSGHFLEESLALCMVTCSSFIAHKQTLENIGSFREEMKTCEDFDLWNRILYQGHSIGLLAENLLVRYGGHEDQLSNKFQAIERFRLYSLLCLANETWQKSESVPGGIENGKENSNQWTNKQNSLKKAILLRLDTLIHGRKKRGKEVQLFSNWKELFHKNQPIPQKDLLTLLDDSLF
ncbi:glycosyltransferase family 2 protein [Leptospira biflexa]|uniref:glycosyltransferase family 2 protein n=1 Tax=Leptospira biflexa TaxID=172 RepID=UPI00109178B3|nr:glycosyltransferase [Leptospira biflexa]TGM54283.1 glycosyltransferase family 2 protein [Leptospira biflexa]